MSVRFILAFILASLLILVGAVAIPRLQLLVCFVAASPLMLLQARPCALRRLSLEYLLPISRLVGTVDIASRLTPLLSHLFDFLPITIRLQLALRCYLQIALPFSVGRCLWRSGLD